MTSDIDLELATRGFVTRPQMLDCGYDDDGIRSLLHDELMIRIGPGLYADPSYATMRPEEQHLLRAKAVNTRFVPGTVVFSHQTAAIIHGCFVWGVDLKEVHLTRDDIGRSRHQAAVFHHVGLLSETEIVEVDGLLVTNGARTAWDVATTTHREAALVTCDSILHLHLADPDDFARMAADHPTWRRAGHATVTLQWADGRSDSPGESRTRFICRAYGLPEPVLQLKIFDESGVLIGIVDFAWPEFRHIAEFDGRIKYGSGEDLAREKWREDRLRAIAWGVTRIIWAQLSADQRAVLAKELYEAMKQSRRLYGRTAG